MRSRPHRHTRQPDRPPEPLPPLLFDPASSRLIANWPTHNAMTVAQQEQLRDALDQVSAYGAALPVACWLFPDGRAPVAIRVEGISLRQWLLDREHGRATYVARSTRRVAGAR